MNKHIKYDRIEISESKLVGYLLNKNHIVGAHKAVFFESLGYDVENWHNLKDALLVHVETAENVDLIETQFGMKIVIINDLQCKNDKNPKNKISLVH